MTNIAANQYHHKKAKAPRIFSGTIDGPPSSGTLALNWQTVRESFDRFCLTAGIATLASMMEDDAERLCGPRHSRSKRRGGHRWGRTTGRLDFHGGTVPVERSRGHGGEIPLPSWEAARSEDWLGRWAMNLTLINVSTRKFGRAVRLPDGDVPAGRGDSRSKSAVSRRFVELSAARMAEWMSSDLSQLGLLAFQIDGLHIREELTLVAAVGIDSEGNKHPLAVVEGATENTATVQAVLDNLIGRGLDPGICRLFIVDGVKALTKGDPADFWPLYADPALSNPQGSQHRRAPAKASSCGGQKGAPSGLGDQ